MSEYSDARQARRALQEVETWQGRSFERTTTHELTFAQISATLFLRRQELASIGRGGGIIDDAPGLGKTGTIANKIDSSVQYRELLDPDNDDGRTLMLVPEGSAVPFKHELTDWLGGGYSIFLYCSNPQGESGVMLKKKSPVLRHSKPNDRLADGASLL